MNSCFSLILQPTLPYLKLSSYPSSPGPSPILQIWKDPRLMNKMAIPFLRAAAPTESMRVRLLCVLGSWLGLSHFLCSLCSWLCHWVTSGSLPGFLLAVLSSHIEPASFKASSPAHTPEPPASWQPIQQPLAPWQP